MTTSAWSPLHKSLLGDRPIASIVSNIRGWMEDTAGAWLMTSLTTSLLLVALMQTAATLPMLLLGLPAATADIFDRRQLLLFWQAIVPELVPRSELMAAIALNSAGC